MTSNNEKKNKIKKLKEEIYKLKIKKLGPITVNNLKKYNFTNNTLILELQMEESNWNLNKIIIDDYKKKSNDLYKKYKTTDILKNLDETHSNNIELIKKTYTDKYIILQNKLRKIEMENTSNILLQRNYKPKIDIKQNNIYKKKNLQLQLYSKIKNLEIKKKELTNTCELELKKITDKYKKKMSLYNCPTLNGGSSEDFLKKCSKLGFKKTEHIYLDKYIAYLEMLKKFCNDYSITSNIHTNCILFDNLDVQKHIDLLRIKNANFKKNKYVIDEDIIKMEHNTKINFKKKNNANTIKILKNYYKLELENLVNLIKYYNKIKVSDYDNASIITKLDTEIIKLDNNIEILNKKYTKLHFDIKLHTMRCMTKVNNLQKEKITLLKEKINSC